MQRLRPDLVPLLRGECKLFALFRLVAFDDPEPPVPRRIPQVSPVPVHRRHDNALPGMALHRPAVAGAVRVIHRGEKGFHLLDIRFFHPGQLPDLDDPVPLELLRAGLV